MQERSELPQRLFLAVRPPSAIVRALDQLPRAREAGVRWVAPEQWHITLGFFARAVPVEVIAATSAVMPPPATTVSLGPRGGHAGLGRDRPRR